VRPRWPSGCAALLYSMHYKSFCVGVLHGLITLTRLWSNNCTRALQITCRPTLRNISQNLNCLWHFIFELKALLRLVFVQLIHLNLWFFPWKFQRHLNVFKETFPPNLNFSRLFVLELPTYRQANRQTDVQRSLMGPPIYIQLCSPNIVGLNNK